MSKPSRRSVVITGAGAVSAAGIGADALWQAARSGKTAVTALELSRDFNSKIKLAAQVKQFAIASYAQRSIAAYCDRFAAFAIVAADEAINQAQLQSSAPLGSATGVIVGAGIGGINTIETSLCALMEQGRADPLTIPKAMPSSAASLLSIRFGCTGPSFAVSSACASATQAIGIGTRMIQDGVVDRVLVGGADSTIAPGAVRTWELLRVLTPDLCRPFSKNRSGMVLGEGAAIFVIESKELAVGREAPILAEVLGYGTSTDAVDMLRPDFMGAAKAMRGALEDAGISSGDIDYINAHGTGTILNDTVEAKAIIEVFGSRASQLPVSSTKPIHGHALGAAGALELLVTMRALNENIAPPTINWTEHDENCPIDPVPNIARMTDIQMAMSNSFAFGGINAALVIGKPRA